MKDILHYHQAAANTRYVSAGLMELMRTIHNEMEKTYFPYNFINYLPWVSVRNFEIEGSNSSLEPLLAWATYERKKNASPDGLAGCQINPIDVNFTYQKFGKFGQNFSWQNLIQIVQGDKIANY